MHILRRMIRKKKVKKLMAIDSLEDLMASRMVLKNQISLLKNQYRQHNLSGPKYYKKFEHVALEMIQINQRIKEKLPLFDVLDLT